ncbi:PhzF family phenazine biosynthesis protein [Vibrio sp.]|uniref:PhzF family phenazine biosynthesis protein n=1 Tax=Vibrio sp. TaxID=678 RepID=UPI003D11A578
MELEIFTVDAFTDKQFGGNSAAVVPVNQWLTEQQMQNIAAENNLSETAFVKRVAEQHYQIRWFSPLTEIAFCGHATLASAYVLFRFFNCQGEVRFDTEQVGSLMVSQQEGGKISMDFPRQTPQAVDCVPAALLEGLSVTPKRVLRNRQAYIAVLEDEQAVRQVTYNSEQLKLLAPYDVVVTAAGNEYDFVSRYFWPANGGDEDPVTGSIHCGLAPYWSSLSGKSELVAYQASQRGGVLYCSVTQDRVQVSGYGQLYMRGTIFI